MTTFAPAWRHVDWTSTKAEVSHGGPPLDRWAMGQLTDPQDGEVLWECDHRHRRAPDALRCANRERLRPHARACGADTSRRVAGQRYVYAHTSCPRMTAHPSGRCKRHRVG